MSRYSDTTIRTKLRALVLISSTLFFIVLVLTLWVLYEYRINGPVYDHLMLRTLALAELEPATLDMADPYSILIELSQTSDPAEIDSLKKQFANHENHFRERENFWLDRLYDGPTKRVLANEVLPAAHDFYRLAKEDYLPLVGKGDRQKLMQIVLEKLKPRYTNQRRIIARAVNIAKETNRAEEKSAAESVRFWLTAVISISIVKLILMSVGGWWMARGIVRGTDALIGRVSEMAAGASDLTARLPVETRDELGVLAEGINATIGKIQVIVQRVREASVQLLSTAAQIGAAARQQETTAHTLGSSTAEIAASVREISATSKELSSTMNEVSERAERAASLADAGQTRLEDMEGAMAQLVQATASVSAKLGVIREKADGINVVVTTITKVADQTNLLSINAAIEAEKAGEYGRGFLVVAREIRRLADQTAVATLDIDNMVRQMRDAVSAGVMQMDKFTEEVRSGVARIAEINAQTGQIIEEVHALSERFRSVNEGVRNQSLGAEQINEAMMQVTEGSRQTRASIDEFKSAADHLRHSVESINQEVSQFKV
jgi:methyl-accepting chemotaxis protein WspA